MDEQRLHKIISNHAVGFGPSVEEVAFLIAAITERDQKLAYADKTIADLHSQIGALQNLQLRSGQ